VNNGENLSKMNTDEQVNSNVQSYLRKAVDRIGLSDVEVARKSRLSNSTVYRLLNAKTLKPSFGVVYCVCSALEIPLPSLNALLPFRSDSEVDNSRSNERRNLNSNDSRLLIHKLEEFDTFEMQDDSGNRFYPKGSIIFTTQKDISHLKLNDRVIVQVSKSNSIKYRIPMLISESPHKGEWILYHLTDCPDKQELFSIDQTTLRSSNSKYSIEILSKIVHALI